MTTRRKTKTPAARKKTVNSVPRTLSAYISDEERLKPGHIQIPLAKVLTLVFNMMEPTADKRVGPELLAEYVGHFTKRDVDEFVMGTVRNLPGYNLSDGLRIAEQLMKWQRQHFDTTIGAA